MRPFLDAAAAALLGADVDEGPPVAKAPVAIAFEMVAPSLPVTAAV